MKPSFFTKNIHRLNYKLFGARRNPFTRLGTTPAAAASIGRGIGTGVTAATTGIATTATTTAPAAGLRARDGVSFNLALVFVCHRVTIEVTDHVERDLISG